MAGDWLKITHELPSKPEVLAIAGRLGINRWEVVGRLHALWTWFDQHTQDGHAHSVTGVTLMDAIFGDDIGDQFADALKAVGWLQEDESGVWAPNFDRHISKTAKNRAVASDRKDRSRKQSQDGHGNDTHVSRHDRDETRDQRREEKKSPPNPPTGYPENFEALWTERPPRAGNNPKREAFQAYNARLKEGYSYDQLIEGLRRYHTYLKATGKLGTEYVQTMATFLGPKKMSFLEEWKPPPPETPEPSPGPTLQKLD